MMFIANDIICVRKELVQRGRNRIAETTGMAANHIMITATPTHSGYVISLANGELRGYIVTEEAALEGGYEASNTLFGPESGKMLVDVTPQLLRTQKG